MKRVFWKLVLSFIILLSSKININSSEPIRDYLNEQINSGKSQVYWAKELGVSRSTISRFLNNHTKKSFKIEKLFRIKLPETYEALTRSSIVDSAGFTDKNVAIQGSFTPSDDFPNVFSYKPSYIKAHKIRLESSYPNAKAPIAIAFRDDGDGKGALYDHFTFQKITSYPTLICAHDSMNHTKLQTFQRGVGYGLTFGESDEYGKKIPPLVHNISEIGLLVIPGRIREKEFDAVRQQHESNLIKWALIRGQPILSICAGSWRLWEAIGGKIDEISDHNYGGGMIRISATTGRVGYNKQIHRIHINGDTVLNMIMGPGNRPTVNSIHWKAPSPIDIPFLAKISAYSVEDTTIAPNSRQGTQMIPESGTIEAYENTYGSPFFGIQWHPEAYSVNEENGDKHQAILCYMADAGSAYYHKRKLLKELMGFQKLIQS